MTDIFSAIAAFDRLCAVLVTALQQTEWQVYPALAVVLTAAYLTFPPRNDLS